MIKVSEELLADSVFDLEAYISKEFARRIGSREEESFFNVDGKLILPEAIKVLQQKTGSGS